jgi:uncharacterized zinc-type alcohol dehydrogenase-like protein
MKLLGLDGTIVLVGLAEGAISVGPFSLTSARSSLAGSAVRGIREKQEMLDFCSRHNIACDVQVIPVQKLNEAYERVVRSDVRYRFVIDIGNSLNCETKN